MNFSPDDPKLTTYALGELPANEAKEIERALEKSPELRAAVDDIRLTAELLKNEFSAEPISALSETQKEAVIANIEPDNVIALPNRSFWRTASFGAIAASILAIAVWQLQTPERQEPVFTVAKQEMAPMIVVAPSASAPNETPPQLPMESPISEAQPKLKPHARESTGEEVALSKSLAQAERKETFAREQSQTRTAFLSDGTSQPTKLDRTGGAGGVPSYDGSIVSSPPVQKLPLVGATPSQRTIAPKDTLADKELSDLRQKYTDNHPLVQQQKKKVEIQLAEPAKATARELAAGSSVSQYPPNSPATSYGIAENRLAADATAPAGVPASRSASSKAVHYNFSEPSHERASRHDWFYAESDFKRKQYFEDHDTARYPKYKENEFESVLENPLSTFSIDVDTASYANVRRFLNERRMPPKDAVRIEEMINYFSYSYPQPKGSEPFSVNMEVANCPWQPEHRLLRVGLKGKEMAQNKRPASNFVFLMDVSGSMSPQERLPLIKQSLRMLVKQMTENDRIAIVVYASNSGVVLESTSAVNKEKILEALDRLEAGGSTNGGQGIQRAYALAEEHFIKGGVNRVILCTDGDFNVGITDQGALIELIQKKAKSGVFLSVLGVGTDNYKDALMQKLADKGNGNYHYLDSVEEAHKVLIKQMNGTLVTIAKDVKIQIEFNPAQVSSYRLVGYEKRILAAEDFNNDKKDAGEIGAGHTVTALYEIVPAGAEKIQTIAAVDDLKYQKKVAATPKPSRDVINGSKEMLTLKLRYKKPDGDKSVLREHTLVDQEKKFSQASTDFRFAASVASFGMVLKDSEHKGRANFGSVLELARESKGDDKEGYRAEFINLVKKAHELQRD